jgi:hypothetical protein
MDRPDKDSTSTKAPVLSYHRRQNMDPPPPPPMMKALLLCFRGALCWTIFISAFAFERVWINDASSGPYFLLWFLAVFTAIGSLETFWKTPKPWYVLVNWTINIAGLLFTLFVLALLVMYVK